MALFDVVIPTYDNLAELGNCLVGLGEQSLADFRALVCVDGSTDGTIDFLSSAQFAFPLLVLSHPGHAHRGRAATRNLAIPHLDSTYVLFLDSDMELDRDALERHRTVLDREPCASVGSTIYRNASSNLWTKYISARRLNRYRAGAHLPYNQFITQNLALRTSDLITLGGFDERLVRYGGEDSELGYRFATELGRPIIANHAARATSTELKSLDEALRQLREYGATNLRYIHARHPAMQHVFRTDRLRSRRPADRFFTAVMNPLTDVVVDALLPLAPFALQEQLINYKVVRAVCQGYRDGEPTHISRSGPGRRRNDPIDG